MYRAESLLRIENLDVAVADVQVCRALTLHLEAGQCWAMLGRNGTGKTTLLHTLAGLRTPRAGTIWVDGQPLASLNRRRVAQRVGLLLQDADDPFPATVMQTALIGRHPHLGPWRFERAEDVSHADDALAAVGLTALRHRDVGTLSGGERRRLSLATLLCQNPATLLLDEPTNHLDLHFQIQLLERIRALVDHGRCALMSLHDVNLAARFCSHALLLFGDGETAAGPVERVLSAKNLERLYRHAMLETTSGGHRLFVPA